jgi:hypothetical protein
MYRKLIMSLAPLLAITAFVVIPAAAQAAPKWEHCVAKSIGKFKDHTCSGTTVANGGWEWEVIPTTTATSQTKEQVKTHGVLTLTGNNGLVIVCQVNDKGVIWNESGVGKDEVTEFVNSNCKAEPEKCKPGTIVASGLPWKTELELVAGVIRDKITGVTITVNCGPGEEPTLTGNLTPKIINSNPTFAEFGAGSGELVAGALKGTVSGKDVLEQSNGWAVRAM